MGVKTPPSCAIGVSFAGFRSASADSAIITTRGENVTFSTKDTSVDGDGGRDALAVRLYPGSPFPESTVSTMMGFFVSAEVVETVMFRALRIPRSMTLYKLMHKSTFLYLNSDRMRHTRRKGLRRASAQTA